MEGFTPWPCLVLFSSHSNKSLQGMCPGTLVPWKTISPIHIQHHIEYSFPRVNPASCHGSLKCPRFRQGLTSSQGNSPSTRCLANHIHTLSGTRINDISRFSCNIRMGYKTEVRKQSLEQTSTVGISDKPKSLPASCICLPYKIVGPALADTAIF